MSDGGTGNSYVDVPTDLQVALAEHASAMAAWRALTRQQRQAHVADLGSAADTAARERCLRVLIHDLEIRVPGGNSR